MMGPHFDTLILLSENVVCTFLALATSELLPNEGRVIDQGLKHLVLELNIKCFTKETNVL